MAPDTSPELARKIDALPRRPGVYLMKDARHEVVYVGKAKDLRARVRSYWQEGGDDWRLISKRIGQVADVDVVVTDSEKEALLLECNFIKQFRPKYNVNFRDDKSFVSIRIDPAEEWTRPVVTRRLDRPGALYFGPYASAKAARKTVRVLQDVFPLRRCSLRECRERKRPCLYGEMGRCSAPCCGEVTPEQYAHLVDQVVLFLRGKGDDLAAELRGEMAAASERMDYELAARLRDRLRAVEATLESQKVSSSMDTVDRDVFGISTVDRHVTIAVLFVRSGNVRDAASYRFPADLDSEQGILASFLAQFYSQSRFIPAEVLLPVDEEDAGLLAEWLTEKKGGRVRVTRPVRGTKRHLVDMANGNARQAENAATTAEEKQALEAESLQRVLGLRRAVRTIECFDISNLQGREAVGSMVVFRDGTPDKASYRRYRIRQVTGQDDFAMMREVLTRRYGKGEPDLPDLVVVDGGKGQLAVALDVLAAIGAGTDGPELAALAKARQRGGRHVSAERVFLPGKKELVELPAHTRALALMTRVRDEAHRFAVAYHRRLRQKAATASPLTEIRGVGRATARRLLAHFGSVDRVKQAGVSELAAVKGVSSLLAAAIYEHYHQGQRGSNGSQPAGEA